jgi:hypothetical protein
MERSRAAVCCNDEFPSRKTLYNLFAAIPLLIASAVSVTSLGRWGLWVFLGTLLVGLDLCVATICNRCSYYGRRCGIGLGRLAPLLRRRGDPAVFCKTAPQIASIVLLAATMLLATGGAIRLAVSGKWTWPALLLLSALALLLPHPRWMCRYCAQRERGPCPIGRALVRPR